MTNSTDGSTDTTFTYFSTTTARSTSPTYLVAYYTKGSTTHSSPTYPSESTTTSILIIIILTIVLSLGSIFGFIYCLVKANNSKLRLEATQSQGTSPSTSVSVCDQLPDYDAVMMEPTAPRVLPPQLIIPSFTQEDDSPPPGYVTPVVISGNNKEMSPPPPNYEEAISSQPNSRANSFTEFPVHPSITILTAE